MGAMTRRLILAVLLVFSSGCAAHRRAPPVARRLPRRGDEIMICGQLYHTRAPVVLWTDPGGYDAYRTERRFAPWEVASFEDSEVDTPNRYGVRFAPLAPGVARHPSRPTGGGTRLNAAQFEDVRGGGWPLELLQQKVDQFVYHYDVCASSRSCFRTLQDLRGLSVHFMLDLDGTIYQTLDLKERAWHATESNDRSIGIEICNIGAYSPQTRATLAEHYRKDAQGRIEVVLPPQAERDLRTPGFVARPARNEVVAGDVQGEELYMYDLTPQQYESLIKLTATVCTVLPRIAPDYPRDARGNLITRALDDAQWESFHGLLGHYHVQKNKQDPGPAFQWDKVIGGVRALMRKPPLPTGDTINDARPTVAAN